jgi:hypothetical protein
MPGRNSISRFFRARLLAILLLAAFFVICCDSLAIACPTCKSGLGNDPQRAALVRGYGWSIIFMMSMPFLILGGLGTYFYLLVRKARKESGTPSLEMIIANAQGQVAQPSTEDEPELAEATTA